jgi:hypothetical protein
MAKQWPPDASAEIVRAIYKRVLERGVDDSGLITWASMLNRGEASVRDLVRTIGKSDEYRNRFLIPFSVREAARMMYRHFLAREAENDAVVDGHAGVIVTSGFQAAVDGFVNSQEYTNQFGEDKVPER